MATRVWAPAAKLAEARSFVYGLLATVLRYPDSALREDLSRLESAADRITVLGQSNPDVARAFDEVRDQLAATGLIEDLQETYTRLFSHVVRGPCPPYELEYGRAEILQQASELADITGFYSAFGMTLAEAVNERADHVSVQCEFMSVLAAKEAYALRVDDAAGLRILVEAQRSFLRDHLARWLPSFARRLREADAGGPYDSIAGLARAFLGTECARLDVACGLELLELRSVDPTRDAAITCESTEGGADPGAPVVQLGIDPAMTGRK